MQPFVVWKVKDREYKLKLSTSAILNLEGRYKTNLINLLDGTPSLAVMLDIVHQALQKYEHGIKEKESMEIYDAYLEEGGSQIDLLKDVVMQIFKVSGFFPKSVAEAMDEKLLEATDKIENM